MNNKRIPAARARVPLDKLALAIALGTLAMPLLAQRVIALNTFSEMKVRRM